MQTKKCKNAGAKKLSSVDSISKMHKMCNIDPHITENHLQYTVNMKV